MYLSGPNTREKQQNDHWLKSSWFWRYLSIKHVFYLKCCQVALTSIFFYCICNNLIFLICVAKLILHSVLVAQHPYGQCVYRM